MASSLLQPANVLAQHLKEVGHPAAQQGNLLTVGSHRIQVNSFIEEEGQKEGHWLVGVGVQVVLDGEALPALRTGAVGVDTSRERAIQSAADQWGMGYGIVVIHSLFPKSSDPPSVAAGPYRIYYGPVLMRGTAEIKDFAAARAQLSRALSTFTSQTFSGQAEWHGMTINVTSSPSKGITSMGQLDGKVSPLLTQAIKGVSWPTGGSSWMLKQFFLAVPAK
jgi:hypothetical protein